MKDTTCQRCHGIVCHGPAEVTVEMKPGRVGGPTRSFRMSRECARTLNHSTEIKPDPELLAWALEQKKGARR